MLLASGCWGVAFVVLLALSPGVCFRGWRFTGFNARCFGFLDLFCDEALTGIGVLFMCNEVAIASAEQVLQRGRERLDAACSPSWAEKCGNGLGGFAMTLPASRHVALRWARVGEPKRSRLRQRCQGT